MKIILGQVEPLSAPHIDKHQAALFTGHLKPSDTFDFNGNQKPKSMLLHTLKFNLPRHSFAHGYLLSIDVDEFIQTCESGVYKSMGEVLQIYVIGSIEIEYGDAMPNIEIRARSLKLNLQ